jgi:hypothetical protein
MLPAKFGSIWPSSFRGEDLFNLTLVNQKQELSLVAIFVGGMGRNEETL